ncbi:MAG: AEC family transporter [Rhodospirillales bacterium]|nr:AEC family transporter [Rhodospirillales bacterium]
MGPVFNVVLPVFGIILAGYLSGRFRLLGKEETGALNKFVYYITLPALLFLAMARVKPDRIFDWHFIGAYAGAMTATFIIAYVLIRVFHPDRRLGERGLFGMAAIYGNTGYMGIPLTLIAFGPEGTVPAIVATVINTAVIIGAIGAMIEVDLSVGESRGAVARDVVMGLLRNPLFTAPLAGIAVSLLGLEVPGPFATFLDIVGKAAGPCALFAIGLFMVGQPIGDGKGEVAMMVGLKLLIQPVIAWALATYVFEMDPLWTKVAILMSALPAGAGLFVVAQKFNVYVHRATSAILVSTVISVLTLSIVFSYFD